MKKRKKLIIAAIALLAVAAIGLTLAFMFKKIRAVNTLTPAVVSCAAYEKLDGKEVSGTTAAVGQEKSDIRVKNTGNINEYLRVRLVSYFVDGEGNISGSAASVYPKITLNDGWIAGTEHTYYYTKPIKPNDETPILCQPFTLLQKQTSDGTKIYQVIEVFAEAVQAEPDAAVNAAWNATVSDGQIESVPQ